MHAIRMNVLVNDIVNILHPDNSATVKDTPSLITITTDMPQRFLYPFRFAGIEYTLQSEGEHYNILLQIETLSEDALIKATTLSQRYKNIEYMLSSIHKIPSDMHIIESSINISSVNLSVIKRHFDLYAIAYEEHENQISLKDIDDEKLEELLDFVYKKEKVTDMLSQLITYYFSKASSTQIDPFSANVRVTFKNKGALVTALSVLQSAQARSPDDEPIEALDYIAIPESSTVFILDSINNIDTLYNSYVDKEFMLLNSLFHDASTPLKINTNATAFPWTIGSETASERVYTYLMHHSLLQSNATFDWLQDNTSQLEPCLLLLATVCALDLEKTSEAVFFYTLSALRISSAVLKSIWGSEEQAEHMKSMLTSYYQKILFSTLLSKYANIDLRIWENFYIYQSRQSNTTRPLLEKLEQNKVSSHSPTWLSLRTKETAEALTRSQLWEPRFKLKSDCEQADEQALDKIRRAFT